MNGVIKHIRLVAVALALLVTVSTIGTGTAQAYHTGIDHGVYICGTTTPGAWIQVIDAYNVYRLVDTIQADNSGTFCSNITFARGSTWDLMIGALGNYGFTYDVFVTIPRAAPNLAYRYFVNRESYYRSAEHTQVP